MDRSLCKSHRSNCNIVKNVVTLLKLVAQDHPGYKPLRTSTIWQSSYTFAVDHPARLPTSTFRAGILRPNERTNNRSWTKAFVRSFVHEAISMNERMFIILEFIARFLYVHANGTKWLLMSMSKYKCLRTCEIKWQIANIKLLFMLNLRMFIYTVYTVHCTPMTFQSQPFANAGVVFICEVVRIVCKWHAKSTKIASEKHFHGLKNPSIHNQFSLYWMLKFFYYSNH